MATPGGRDVLAARVPKDTTSRQRHKAKLDRIADSCARSSQPDNPPISPDCTFWEHQLLKYRVDPVLVKVPFLHPWSTCQCRAAW